MTKDTKDEVEPTEGLVRQSDPPTSFAAAAADFSGYCNDVLQWLRNMGESTSYETALGLGVHTGSITPRFVQLERKGLIYRTLKVRRSPISGKWQIVWAAKPPKGEPG